MSIKGRINSIQSLGTVDGPGIRFVVFFQGCPLRCKCCHNPDTWDINGGTEISAEEIVEKAKRCKSYFGEKGGITLSGGEPLLQPEFALEIFRLCHAEGINTCLDTSGCILTDAVKDLLKETDRVLLDIKFTENSLYKENVGCSMQAPLEFIDYLNEKRIPVTLRQVIIPGLNNNKENILKLRSIANTHICVDKTELLPFKKICAAKYDAMGINFPLSETPTPTASEMAELNKLL